MDAAARKLAIQIRVGRSAAELLHLLDGVLDGPIFDDMHASEAYRLLARWNRQGGLTPSDKGSPVLSRLEGRLQDMALKGELQPFQVSNVFWSLLQLSDGLGGGISKGLLMALVMSLGEKARGMDSQELSFCLWACVQLKAVAREVLTALPELAAQISIKAKDMSPFDISHSLWAAILLKDDCPEVLQMVPALLAEIPRALAVGSRFLPPPNSKNDFLGFAASRFNILLPRLKGNDLKPAVPSVAWAWDKVNFYHMELLLSVAQRLKSDGTLQTLTDWSLCAMLWSYDVLDPDDQFVDFKEALASERVRSLESLADDLRVPKALVTAFVKSFSRKTENVVTTSVNTEAIKGVRNG